MPVSMMVVGRVIKGGRDKAVLYFSSGMILRGGDVCWGVIRNTGLSGEEVMHR